MVDHAGCSFDIDYVNVADLFLSPPETLLSAVPETFSRRNKAVE
jgi:hypothetical protein